MVFLVVPCCFMLFRVFGPYFIPLKVVAPLSNESWRQSCAMTACHSCEVLLAQPFGRPGSRVLTGVSIAFVLLLCVSAIYFHSFLPAKGFPWQDDCSWPLQNQHYHKERLVCPCWTTLATPNVPAALKLFALCSSMCLDRYTFACHYVGVHAASADGKDSALKALNIRRLAAAGAKGGQSDMARHGVVRFLFGEARWRFLHIFSSKLFTHWPFCITLH